jgi:DNA polymerase
MKDHLYVDIETFSEVDIKSAGTVKYCLNCEVMLIGFKLNGRYGYWDFSESGSTIPDWVHQHVTNGGKVVAHNALFEHVALNYSFILFPDLNLEQLVDTQALCGAAGLPLALGKATAAAGLNVQKYDGGTRLITKFCIPRKPTKHNKSTRNMPSDFPEDWLEFRDVYLKADIDSMEELHDFLPPLTEREQRVWEDTQTVNLYGVQVDIPTVELIRSKLDVFVDEEATKFVRLVGLFPTQRDKCMAWVRSQGVKITNMQAATIQGVLEDPNTPELVREALTARANTTHMSFKKYDKMIDAACEDGSVKGTLMYHVAHTGRFGGRLLQPQNLTRGSIDGEEAVERIQGGEFSVELVKSAVRSMIKPEGGVTIVDYSSIEARLVQFMACDEDALDVFRRGDDPYIWMGGKIYGVYYMDVNDKQRFTGKQAILGLGYQMSAKKFVQMVESYGETITMQEASLAVKVYRETHSKLVRFWKSIESAAIMAVNRPGKLIKVNRHVSFIFEGLFLKMNLPSGRQINYFKPVIEPGMYGESLSYMSMNDKNQYVRTSTYGGKLTENLVQGAARDLLVDAVTRLLDQGHNIVTHIHDEVVVEGQHRVGDIADTMCELPEWAKGLPLGAEGKTATRYKKA